MKIFMTGATGLVGRAIRHRLSDQGHEILALTRHPRPPADKTEWLVADPLSVSAWGSQLDGCDAIINLAGEPIAQRWTRGAMQRIVQSRVGVTTALFHAVEAAKNPPKVMLSASAVGFYGTSETDTFDESSPVGDGFLARVCDEWESAARRSDGLTRVVRARFGIVLSRDGGALPKLAAPYRMFMGGPLASGRQWMSWIHLQDLVKLTQFVLENDNVRGAVNFVAPHPVQNKEFSQGLARALKTPNLMGAGKIWLQLFLGKMARDTIIEGQRVEPSVAQSAGFEFDHPDLDSALGELFKR